MTGVRAADLLHALFSGSAPHSDRTGEFTLSRSFLIHDICTIRGSDAAYSCWTSTQCTPVLPKGLLCQHLPGAASVLVPAPGTNDSHVLEYVLEHSYPCTTVQFVLKYSYLYTYFQVVHVYGTYCLDCNTGAVYHQFSTGTRVLKHSLLEHVPKHQYTCSTCSTSRRYCRFCHCRTLYIA